jgi:hypothetical protein
MNMYITFSPFTNSIRMWTRQHKNIKIDNRNEFEPWNPENELA